MNGFGTSGGRAPDALAGGMISTGGIDEGELASALAGPLSFGLFKLALANDNFDADALSSVVALASKVGRIDSPKMSPNAAEFQTFGSPDATPQSAIKLSFVPFAVGALSARVTGHHFTELGVSFLHSKFAGDVTVTSRHCFARVWLCSCRITFGKSTFWKSLSKGLSFDTLSYASCLGRLSGSSSQGGGSQSGRTALGPGLSSQFFLTFFKNFLYSVSKGAGT